MTKQTRGIDSDDAFSNNTHGRVIQFGISSNSTLNDNNTANTGENSTSIENNENETSYFNSDKSDDSVKNDNENENNENNESNEINQGVNVQYWLAKNGQHKMKSLQEIFLIEMKAIKVMKAMKSIRLFMYKTG